jgi:hypothetical protein
VVSVQGRLCTHIDQRGNAASSRAGGIPRRAAELHPPGERRHAWRRPPQPCTDFNRSRLMMFWVLLAIGVIYVLICIDEDINDT